MNLVYLWLGFFARLSIDTISIFSILSAISLHPVVWQTDTRPNPIPQCSLRKIDEKMNKLEKQGQEYSVDFPTTLLYELYESF
jgi:hypothetical protein